MRFESVAYALVLLILLALLAEAVLHAVDRDAELQEQRVVDFRSHWRD